MHTPSVDLVSPDRTPVFSPDPEVVALVEALADGLSPIEAAVRAGLQPAQVQAMLLMPKVIDALRERLALKLGLELQPAAIATLNRIIRDETGKISPAVQAKTALGALEYMRRLQRDAKEDASKRSLTEMTSAELEAHLRELRAQEAALIPKD